ncbi:hypothetical protein K435DRAFT_971348 [Dendrothele bispora CBS 962.96]|uniref:Spindle assembly checkpoint component MAD1 n=1 Tax=Dendrothele bispora (strain CBS 962.96) TaxID=1314807 RepID=A0A4S8L5X4_DENBC|nr:hypothetical protein K435DRAFT_971348 [Dendrothele bispora CBS 962.96]
MPTDAQDKEKPFTASLRSRTILERTNNASATPSSSRAPTSSGTVVGNGGGVGTGRSTTSRMNYRTTSTLGTKRDSAQAELEHQDNILATKRQLQSTLSSSSLERQLALAQTRLSTLQKSVSEKDAKITLLEQDRRYLSTLNESQATANSESERKLEDELAKLREQLKSERELRQKKGECERLKGEVGNLRGRIDELENEVAMVSSKSRRDSRSPVPPSSTRSTRSPGTSVETQESDEARTATESPAQGDQTLNPQHVLESELAHQAGYLRTVESANTKLQAELAILKEELKALKERSQQTPGIWKELSILREEKRSLEGKLKRRDEEVERLVREGERTALEASTSSFHNSLRRSTSTTRATPAPGGGDASLRTLSASHSRGQGGSLMARSMRSRIGKNMAETPLKGRGSIHGSGSALGGVSTSTSGSSLHALGEEGTDEMTLDELVSSSTSTSRGAGRGRGEMQASTSVFGLGTSVTDTEMDSVIEEDEREVEVDELGSVRNGAVAGEEVEMMDEEEEPYEDPPSIHVTADVAALRLSHAKLLDEYGELKAELEGLRRRCRCGESSSSSDTKSVGFGGGGSEDDDERVEREKDEILNLKIKLRTVEDEAEGAKRELAFLTEVLAKYDADEKAKRASSPTTSGASAGVVDDLTAARLARLDQLESMYTQAKSSNSSLRSEIQTLQTKLDKALSELGNLKQENTSLQSRITSLKSEVVSREEAATANSKAALSAAQEEIQTHLKKIDELEQELFELTGEMAAGRHVPPGVRVLEMKENPAKQWFDSRAEVVEQLKKENEELLKRLGVLEKKVKLSGDDGDGQTADGQTADGNEETQKQEDSGTLVPRSSLDTLLLEKQDLTTRLDKAEKRNERLRKVFSAKTEEFKACLASILGVKLAFYQSGEIRVTSIFDLDTQLMFAPPSAEEKKKRKVLLDEKDLEGGTREMKLVSVGEGTAGGKGKEASERAEDLSNMINYWVRTEACVPGLMASVTLEAIEKMKREGRSMGDWGMTITAD